MIRTLGLLLAMSPLVAFADTGIPDAIKVPAGHQAYMTVHAKGQQIYLCNLEQGNYAWKVQAPDAQLFDDDGRIVGKHYKGPIWEYKEGSQVQGKILERYDYAPGYAIPWLLVKVVATKGKGAFTGTSYINRVNTEGGMPPGKGCDGNHLGGEKRVNYTADYIFYYPIQAEKL